MPTSANRPSVTNHFPVKSFFVLTFVFGFTLLSSPAMPATINVTANATDTLSAANGQCSMREAITNINDATTTYADCASAGAYGTSDTINIQAGTYTIILAGASEDNNATGDYDIWRNVSIVGAGAGLTIIDGGGLDRVFDIKASSSISFVGVTITGGSASYGGCIYTYSGALTITSSIITGCAATYGGGFMSYGVGAVTNSTISGNTATYGGGFMSYGVGAVTNSTISGNTATYGGGGIYNLATLTVTNSTISGNTATYGGGIMSDGALTVTNSTITGNTTTSSGGGIYSSATLTVANSTISGNTATLGGGVMNYSAATFSNTIVANQASGADCYDVLAATTLSTGNNLSSDASCGFTSVGDLTNTNPMLAALAFNGGPTQTMALQAGSPAINTGSCAQATDQRGALRPQGATCDIGAFEVAQVNYTVTGSAGAGGAVTPATQSAPSGLTASFTVTANTGYTTNTTVGGTCPAGSWSGATYTTGVVTANCSVSFSFSLMYTVTATSGTGGTVAPSVLNVASGSTASFAVTPNTGYTTSSTVTETCPAGSWNGATYTTGAVTANCSVSFSFAQVTYGVTATAGANGTVLPASQTVAHGSTTSFTVTPNTGYTTDTTVGGTCPAGSWSGTTYTTGAVTAACSVSFSFTINTYTVSATAGANGSVTPASRTVNHGSTVSFTVAANSGYTTDATVGGACPAGLWSGTTYTTGAITGACDVSFSFTQIQYYAVAATSTTGGTITPVSQTVAGGSTATFAVTPNTGWTTLSVTGCGGTLVGNTYTTAAITAACNVSATFAAAPTVTTGAIGGISSAGTASAPGLVNANGASTTVYFNYGTTTAYGTTIAATTTPTGYDTQSLTGALTGLTCGTTYHYRVTATNSVGTTNGSDATFAACVSKTYGDFNGDGTTDILWRDTSNGKNSIWLMNGTTKLSGASLTTVATSYLVAGLGDFNGDGMADILWRDWSTGKNSIWLMNGTAKTGGGTIQAAGANWSVVGVADFDGEGMADILWRDLSTGKNVLWLMNGTTKTGGGTIPTAGSNWSVAGVADFDGNGMADILWRDSSTGKNVIWFMNGTTKSSGASLTTVNTAYSVAGVADFNGDGMADILWRDKSTGKNVIWFMNGAMKTSGASLTTVNTSYSVVRIGDFDADGLADILWRDKSTGKNVIWFMNGATKTGGGAITVAGSNWKVKP